MRKVSEKIASIFIKDHKNVTDSSVRTKYGLLEGWISIFGNIILFIVKIVLGISINSASLITDAIHTLSDSVSSAIIIIGFYFAGKPSDKDHPFGHERIEFVIALIVSVLLIVTGIEMGKSSFMLVLNPVEFTGSNWVIAIIFITLVLKELMARFSYELADIIDSDALKADAFHHRSDVFATACVIVALIGSRFGYYYLDGIMGIIVSIVIIYSGYEIAKEAVDKIIGTAPSYKTLKEIESIAKGVDGVFNVHDIIVNSYGTRKIISLHVEISSVFDAVKMHKIADNVEKEIEGKINGKVVVHVDPVKIDSLYKDISSLVNGLIENTKCLKSFHGLQIEEKRIQFEVVLKDACTSDSEQELKNLINKVADRYSDYQVNATVDPHYIYNL